MNNATKDCEPGSLPVSLPSLTATITKEKLDTNAHSCMKQYNNCKNKKQGQAAREEVADTTQVSVTHDYFNSYQHGLGTSLPPPLPRREITPDSRISMKKNSQNDQYEMSLLSNNNSSLRILPGSINNNNEDLFTKSIEESKYPPFIGDYYKHVLLYDSDSRSEKRERGIKYTDKVKNIYISKITKLNEYIQIHIYVVNNAITFYQDYFFPVPFPWKRIAYVGVLLVLGITCLILALMKICGIADWMVCI